jgi:hypothetical protein
VTAVETVARARVGSGARVEQLVSHQRLPLVAVLDSQRPAVHVWDCGGAELRELGTIGGDSPTYGDGHPWAARNPEIAIDWDRRDRAPSVAWHPDQPLLLVASEGRVARWTPDGVSEMDGIATGAAYREIAFSPDGQALWASPSPEAKETPWEPCSDAIDLASGAVTSGRGWDTGIAAHPGGGLVATLRSDQGATLVIFARAGQAGTPPTMRVLRRAIILDADGYKTPVFSADGRRFAIRGNAYENSLEVFEFPSLDRAFALTLGEPNPGHPAPPQWREDYRAWSRQNIAFGTQPGVLWVGTPTGSLVELDLDNEHAVAHNVLAGSAVTALCATAAGGLLVATGAGDLALISVVADSVPSRPADARTAQDLVAAFLDASPEVPADGDLENLLVLTNGTRTWAPDALKTVTAATSTDPTWLRLRAALNKAFTQEQP